MTCTRPCTCPDCTPHTPARRAQAAWWLREACGCLVCVDAQERALTTIESNP